MSKQSTAQSKIIRTGPRRQDGAVTVESAIIVLLFVVILFAIMEFSVFIYRLSSMADATRDGARHLSISSPLIDLSSYTCDTLPGPASCSGNSACDSLVTVMQRQLESLTADNIFYEYKCASTGFDESYFQIYSIDVWVEDLPFAFITPGLAPIPFDMPTFRSTRLSEDLDTVE